MARDQISADRGRLIVHILAVFICFPYRLVYCALSSPLSRFSLWSSNILLASSQAEITSSLHLCMASSLLIHSCCASFSLTNQTFHSLIPSSYNIKTRNREQVVKGRPSSKEAAAGKGRFRG